MIILTTLLILSMALNIWLFLQWAIDSCDLDSCKKAFDGVFKRLEKHEYIR